jgi:hypothetical protein
MMFINAVTSDFAAAFRTAPQPAVALSAIVDLATISAA